MALAKSYSGAGYVPGYAGISAQVFQDADRNNGKVMIPGPEGGMYWPRLSNGQIAALAMAWKRAASRSKAPSWPDWYPIVNAALGWEKKGDRYIMTAERAAAPAAPELLEFFWRSSDELAKRLDAAGTKRAPLIVDWSFATYEAAARDAWQQMQSEDRGSPDGPARADPAPQGSDGGLLLVLVIVAVMVSRK